jgi:hypothetical protein
MIKSQPTNEALPKQGNGKCIGSSASDEHSILLDGGIGLSEFPHWEELLDVSIGGCRQTSSDRKLS